MYYSYFMVSATAKCDSFRENKLLVQNCTFEKHPYDDNVGGIFHLTSPGNFTITDNRFLNF